jgi:hypothetical protein
LQDEYLAIAEDCDKRVVALTATVRGAFERAGGLLENAKLDLINLKEQQNDPKQAKPIKPAAELKKIELKIDEGESQVAVGSKALDKARADVGSIQRSDRGSPRRALHEHLSRCGGRGCRAERGR